MNVAEELGKVGEDYTAAQIRKSRLYAHTSKLLRNVYIPNQNHSTEEVDIIFIMRKGVFVFENKNYSGWIFGDEKDLKWTQALSANSKNRFSNPVMQNQTHVKWLKNFLGQDVFCYSVIIFSKRCTLKKVTVKAEDTLILKSDQLIAELDRLEHELPDKLTDEQVDRIFLKLSPHTGLNVDDSVIQNHIDRVQIGFLHANDNPNEQKCPRCGSALILRTAKHGANAGKQFYGCTAYPKCKYIRNISDSEGLNGNSFPEFE